MKKGKNSTPAREKMQAAALKYERGNQQAPQVVAKGAGVVAEKIIAAAREHGIPLHEDPELIQVLMKLDLNEEIPAEIYQVVADILAMVYRASKKYQP
ncbi:MAG: EscU/YscU/HrcU family type III secretion system export apparatus switch protein [Deltaproteobacteria bacterium]|nr:EscU/YscU/HrcU family type III secretion system export apparatus switch protein [Deltaproteobacteria bacterium]